MIMSCCQLAQHLSPSVLELYAGFERFYPLECYLISGNGGACHHSDTQLPILMLSLRHLSSLDCQFDSLNLDHWWKCNVSSLNMNCRIYNLKWHPLIWSPVYAYSSYWKLNEGIYFLNTSNFSFSPLHFQKTPKLSTLPLTVSTSVVISSSHREPLSLPLPLQSPHHRDLIQIHFRTPSCTTEKHLVTFNFVQTRILTQRRLDSLSRIFFFIFLFFFYFSLNIASVR